MTRGQISKTTAHLIDEGDDEGGDGSSIVTNMYRFIESSQGLWHSNLKTKMAAARLRWPSHLGANSLRRR
jgi:hypothetical protein